ncbi:MAG: hypothetical protein WC789_07645 [Lentisphaeria bacterium]|jgi:hypothetical protein
MARLTHLIRGIIIQAYERGEASPLLRDFFYQLTGPRLDDEPFASFVDDLVRLLARTDMAAVLADFGKRTRQEDPVVHRGGQCRRLAKLRPRTP